MRGFIKFCGGLFVVIGIVGFVIAAMSFFASMKGGGLVDLTGALGIVLASAAVTLIGGTSYILCSIDERLEQFRTRRPNKVISDAAMKNAPAIHSREW